MDFAKYSRNATIRMNEIEAQLSSSGRKPKPRSEQLARAAKTVAGGAVGATAGAATGVALGAALGAYETVGLSVARTREITDSEGNKSTVVVPRLPGIVETAVAGGVTAGAVSLLALNPVAWPIVGGVVAAAGVEGAAAGFVAGVTGMAAYNVGLGAALGGITGSVGGAVLGVMAGRRI